MGYAEHRGIIIQIGGDLDILKGEQDDFICGSWKYLLRWIWTYRKIYTEKDVAEAAKDLIIKELYEKEIARGQITIVENVSDIEVNILEIEAEKLVNIELGGYCE